MTIAAMIASGRPTIAEPDRDRRRRLADADQRAGRPVRVCDRVPAAPDLFGRRRGRKVVDDGQGPECRPLLEDGLLGDEPLDLPADVRQLALDIEDVGDPRRLGHDLLEGGFARSQVGDPGAEIDDLARHGLGCDLELLDLGSQAADAIERLVPADRRGRGRRRRRLRCRRTSTRPMR